MGIEVVYNGKPIYRLNSNLLDRQKCWDNVEMIKALHVEKLKVYDVIKNTDDKEVLKNCAGKITEIEFMLQSKWNFPEDARFHRFWDTPKCICAKIDNNDSYPSGYYSVNGSCPLHGV